MTPAVPSSLDPHSNMLVDPFVLKLTGNERILVCPLKDALSCVVSWIAPALRALCAPFTPLSQPGLV